MCKHRGAFVQEPQLKRLYKNKTKEYVSIQTSYYCENYLNIA